jgi:hypothetical protein
MEKIFELKIENKNTILSANYIWKKWGNRRIDGKINREFPSINQVFENKICLPFIFLGSRLRVPVFVFQEKIIIGEEIFSFVPYRLKIR